MTHNIFEKGKYMRTISLNCSYLVVFNNLRDKKQIKYLGTQLFPGEIKYFEEILQDVFLNIDLLSTSLNEFRLRTFEIVYVYKIVYVYIKN